MEGRKAKPLLIVDGYNIIGAWPELRALKEQDRMDEARDLLISKLADYQGVSGMEVIIVFDAHSVPGLGRRESQHRVEIYYTKEKETADERIEKLVLERQDKRRQIYVATSDHTSQRVIFGQGALRKSARELLHDLEGAEREIAEEMKRNLNHSLPSRIPLPEEIAKIFEKWRRE